MIVDGEWGRAMKERNSILVLLVMACALFMPEISYAASSAIAQDGNTAVGATPAAGAESSVELSGETIEPAASAAEPQLSDANGENVQKPNDSSGSPVDPAPEVEPLLSLRVGTMLMLHGISSVAGHPSPGGIRFAAIGIGSMLLKTARWQRGGSMWPVRVITWPNPVLLKELWQRDGFATRGLGISRTSQEPFFRIGNGLVVPGIGLIRVAAARWRVGSTLLTGMSICWAIMGSQMAGCLMGRCGITAQMGKL